MKRSGSLVLALSACLLGVALLASCMAQSAAPLPTGVTAVWDLAKAYRETTPTRERVCINGLWRWQPAKPDADAVPTGEWGYFKVPGSWPGVADYVQNDSQTAYPHAAWKDQDLGRVTAAWYEREITPPASWAGRRIALSADTVNSYAALYVDGKRAGEIHFPGGEVDLTAACTPGAKHVLSLLVVAMPLKGVMMSYNDTAGARQVTGSVQRRGLCGDVFLESTPPGARVTDVKIDPSVRKWEITFDTGLDGLAADGRYTLAAEIMDGDRKVTDLTSDPFSAADLKDGRFAFTAQWHPGKLWDTNTPRNQYDAALSLRDAQGKALDAATRRRFGFREFWIDGRDFYLNGTRIYLAVVPLDNAQVSAQASTYEATKRSLLRLRSFGTNFLYTHNYGCEPGTHLSFAEILRAADDVGMLVALSQPHFGQYDWDAADADESNGYARHAEHYVRVAQNHPSVVAYSTSHNATGYVESMNPDWIDGIKEPVEDWARSTAQRALRAEGIVKRFDQSRIVYHHSSGNLGSMHTNNFYANWVPVQELDDWFEHWATVGVKPMFLCEFGVPCTWDFTMYRGWYKGARTWGSAVVPWELCLSEWNAQNYGDAAYKSSDVEKACLRWEAKQFQSGNLWHRWDYPYQIGTTAFTEQYPALALYLTDNWRALRTWGVSAVNPWQWECFWTLREGVDKSRQPLPVDWANLQRPGFSPDFIEHHYDRMDLSYEPTDWEPTVAAQALMRNNMPLLAYIGGKAAAFTSKDHNFRPGESVEKQLIVINNSREPVTADCQWSLALPQALTGKQAVTVPPGQQQRLPLTFALPAGLAPASYDLAASVEFSTGETQSDTFTVDVLPAAPEAPAGVNIALFDPAGETAKLLAAMGVQAQAVDANADLTPYAVLIIGKGALTVDGAAPNLSRMAQGLRVIVFEQTRDALEKRLGFRAWEWGLRQVFERVPDHPLLAGVTPESLHDWRGEATLTAARLDYVMSPTYRYVTPTAKWCDIDVPRIWRCGCRGNVASVLIEKPACGDFLPVIDGGYSLQFSPLMEYREGQGMILFCQLDVTGRTEPDPAADSLARNIIRYVSEWKPAPNRKALYVGDPAGRRHLEHAGIAAGAYDGGNLAADQVLIVGPGGGQTLAANKAEVAGFLRTGGNLLALGLDAEEANSFLPAPVVSTSQEHIASYFEPLGTGSLFAGLGPADVQNKAPRELPLVSGGATVIGDGVLAQADNANVVFDQLPPWTLTRAEGAVPSFVVDGGEAVDGTQSALVTLGTTTDAGGQFGQGVKVEPQVGQTYTFAAFVEGVGGPAEVRLEIERAGSPWDRAVKGETVQVPDGQWTEIHVTFKVEKTFPRGWQAYIGGGQDGAVYRADMLRLYEGDYVAWTAADPGPENLITNPSFEAGAEPWWFQYGEQYNLRRTYRRTSFALTRLLANMGVAGSTPLLSRFGAPAKPDGSDKRWLDGLYVDEPEAWDDPYRFFCW